MAMERGYIALYRYLSFIKTLEAWNSNSVVASGTVTVNTGYVSASFAQDLFYAAETTGWGNGAGAPLAPFSSEMISGGDWADGYGPTLNVGD